MATPPNRKHPADKDPVAPDNELQSPADDREAPSATEVDDPRPDGAADESGQATRVEHLLEQIRGLLDASARDRGYREFSPTRLIGAVIQALVIGLLAWALSDWVFQSPPDALFIKLGFAAVLQLVALTAFLATRQDAPPR